MKLGLVLEGGGMRCIYTVGVLDALQAQGLLPDYLIGVSAGASAGVSYLSGQAGRGKRIFSDYVTDKRYLSLRNWLRTGSVFGMEYLYKDLPETIDPFDYAAFARCPVEFRVGVTNVRTGCAEYFGKDAMDGDSAILAASASIPLLAKPVAFRGERYLDGGTADPIPVLQALREGCTHVVVVLTRDRQYRKTPQRFGALYHALLGKMPEMARLLDLRHALYNETLARLATLEKEGVAHVIAPRAPLPIDRFEKRRDRLLAVHRMGEADGKTFLECGGAALFRKA